jgi:hypothetical protein
MLPSALLTPVSLFVKIIASASRHVCERKVRKKEIRDGVSGEKRLRISFLLHITNQVLGMAFGKATITWSRTGSQIKHAK